MTERQFFIVNRKPSGELQARKVRRDQYDHERDRARILKQLGVVRMRSVCAGWNQALVIY